VEYLHAIFKDAESSSLIPVPKLEKPTNQYAYIQKAAVSIRKMMNLDQGQMVEAQQIIDYMRSFPIVFIPVLWGEKGDQALVINLQKLHMFGLCINVETKICDFTFWLLHELAHILTPELSKEDAEMFADSFAGALLFPEACAKALIKRILKEAKTRTVAPICIFTAINSFLTENDKPILDFDIYGTSTNFLKSVPLLSDLLFRVKSPSAQEYINETSLYFGSDFWDALTKWIIENNKKASAVQTVLNIPLSDAKEVWAYLSKRNS